MTQGFFTANDLASFPAPPQIAKCMGCGLDRGCKSPRMPLSGKGKRRILVIGEAPGETEDEDGIQFVGESGKLLEKSLQNVGISLRKDCWVTNAVRCRPPKNKMQDKYVKTCRPNVMRDIREKKPDMILLFGMSAVKCVIGSIWKESIGSLERWVGWHIPCQTLNAWICPTWHPSYLLRSKNHARELHFNRHLEAIAGSEGKPWGGSDVDRVPDYASNVQIEYDLDDVAEWISRIRGGTIAFDYEANCLKPDSPWAEIVSCSVCWEGRQTMAFPWVGKVVPAMGKLLADPSVKKIAQNLKFEERWTWKEFGHGVKGWLFDTMLGTHLLDNRRGITGLKFQAFVQLGVGSYDDSIAPFLKSKDSRSKNRIREANLRDVLLYNGMDAVVTYEVAMKQRKGFE